MGESPWKFESSWPHQTVLCILYILRLRGIGGRNPAIPGASGGSGSGNAVEISGLGKPKRHALALPFKRERNLKQYSCIGRRRLATLDNSSNDVGSRVRS